MNLIELVLPYIHAIASVVFIATLIGLRSHAGFYLDALKEEKLLKNIFRLKLQLHIMLVAALVLLVVSGVLTFVSEDPIFSTLASTQWSLYLFALLNLGYIYFLFSQINKLAARDDIAHACERLAIMLYYFVPLNIILCIAAMFFTLILDSII